jgi:hypothetical protein
VGVRFDPDEQWDDDPRQDWTQMLARHGRVITLSSHTARAIRRTMGEDFPVLVLPTPLWDTLHDSSAVHVSAPINPRVRRWRSKAASFDTPRLACLPMPDTAPIHRLKKSRMRGWLNHRSCASTSVDLKRGALSLPGITCVYGLNRGSRANVRPVPRVSFSQLVLGRHSRPGAGQALREPGSNTSACCLIAAGDQRRTCHRTPAPSCRTPSGTVRDHVDGVVYVSVFNPEDGRKNWHHLITAFCWAFRDTSDATLVLKITQNDLASYYSDLMTLLAQLSPFACRVVVMHGYLDDEEFARLYQAASFYVNASRCEGLCLPLMEFMAVRQTGDCAESHGDGRLHRRVGGVRGQVQPKSLTIWPQDTRIIYRTLRHRPDWGSLKIAYEDSYRMAKTQPEEPISHVARPSQRMHDYCAFAPVQQRMADFFGLAPKWYHSATPRHG